MNTQSKDALELARALKESLPTRSRNGSTNQPNAEALFDALITSRELTRVTQGLFLNGHYAQAVEEGYKFLNNLAKKKAGFPRDSSGKVLDGVSLMLTAFSSHRPLLKFNNLSTDSKKNFQMGYMHILEGCMMGVRNPRAHEHGYPDDPRNALELLALCNHLIRFVDGAKRSRRTKSPRKH